MYEARKVAGTMVCGLMTQRNWDFLIGREMVCMWQQSKRVAQLPWLLVLGMWATGGKSHEDRSAVSEGQ